MAWPKPGRKSKRKRPGSRRCLPNVSCGVCSRRKRRIGKHGVLSYQLHAAKFPIHRDFVHFDWNEMPLLQPHMAQLATAGFMADAHNLILVGGTGTGKTHLATALGAAAIQQGKRVRFFNAVDWVNRLEQEKQ
jgi:DNA replication protein DnaC